MEYGVWSIENFRRLRRADVWRLAARITFCLGEARKKKRLFLFKKMEYGVLEYGSSAGPRSIGVLPAGGRPGPRSIGVLDPQYSLQGANHSAGVPGAGRGKGGDCVLKLSSE